MNNPETNLTNTNESKTEINKTYLRFYHVFECQELENLFKGIENVSIIESYYEQGNWCVIFEKISK
jgi:alkylated DNA repair protein alkB family protein 8